MKSAGDTRAEALVSSYERAGYTRVAPPILQPAEPFLDLSGEDIRRRMYFVAEAGGEELCLRPDLTIPVAREYLAAAPHSGPQNYCYLGPVFRQGGGDSGEILQAGVESFGRNDADAADAETLALAFEAAASFGADRAVARTGDVALFSTLLDALDLAPVWKRRLAKDFNRKSDLAHDLERLFVKHTNGKPEYQGVFAAFANADPRAARALVTDLLSIAGISTVGGRTVGEIADRFLEQAELGAGSALPGEIQNVIERFLAITGALHDAAAQLRALAHDAGIALAPAIDRLETRTGFLVARSVDVRRISFATAFGRGLDYYTGFVFELHDPQNAGDGPLAAGGRYDGLLTRLGDGPSAPAVGFAAWIDRLAARAGRP